MSFCSFFLSNLWKSTNVGEAAIVFFYSFSIHMHARNRVCVYVCVRACSSGALCTQVFHSETTVVITHVSCMQCWNGLETLRHIARKSMPSIWGDGFVLYSVGLLLHVRNWWLHASIEFLCVFRQAWKRAEVMQTSTFIFSEYWILLLCGMKTFWRTNAYSLVTPSLLRCGSLHAKDTRKYTANNVVPFTQRNIPWINAWILFLSWGLYFW